MELWVQQIETLEEISQNDEARRLFLRMAQLSQEGEIDRFLNQIVFCEELDAATRSGLTELASDPAFLAGFDDYVRKTQRFH
jgi:hypothetical protein